MHLRAHGLASRRDEGLRSGCTYFVSNKTTTPYLLNKQRFTVIANIYWVLPVYTHSVKEFPVHLITPFFPRPQEAADHHYLCFMAGKTQAHEDYMTCPRSNNKEDKDLEHRSQSSWPQCARPTGRPCIYGKPEFEPFLFNSRSSMCVPLIIRVTDDYLGPRADQWVKMTPRDPSRPEGTDFKRGGDQRGDP